nr:MAG TPA: hypothetical protein [Caudoviricetes sp.]
MCPSSLYVSTNVSKNAFIIGFLHSRLTGFRHIRTTVSLTCERGLCCSRTYPTTHTQRLLSLLCRDKYPSIETGSIVCSSSFDYLVVLRFGNSKIYRHSKIRSLV